jgi:redox-sensing transcriptional repressor
MIRPRHENRHHHGVPEVATTPRITDLTDVPEVVIERLPHYLRTLIQFNNAGVEIISSHQLGAELQITSAQIRKDLSYFGRFGKQGRGYNVRHLLERLRHILGLQETRNVAVVGAGRLGRAIIGYPGFAPEGFKIKCVFDSNPRLVGQIAGGLMIHDMSNMKEILSQENVQIVILAVPADNAQDVIHQVVRSNIKVILNYAPIAAHVPSDVHVRNVDPVLALQSMAYHLNPDG